MENTKRITPPYPVWYDGKKINEPLFCECFIRKHPLAYTGNSFFTVDGILSDLSVLRRWIFEELKPYIATNTQPISSTHKAKR